MSTAAEHDTPRDSNFILGSGEMSVRVRNFDWSQTPIGPLHRWPQSLRTVVNILLCSRYSMWMAWGKDLTFLCNDAYLPTLGVKRTWALGARANDVWSEIWLDIGPRIESVLATGKATYDEGLLLFLERSGFPEETYHTFSYSPLTDEQAQINGMLCVVTEETDRLIAERRVETLREVAAALANTKTEEGVFHALSQQLSNNRKDLPFTLTYLFDANGGARLAAASAIPENHPLAVDSIHPENDLPWPARRIFLQPEPLLIEDLSAQHQIGELPKGDWYKPPDRVIAVPIKQQGDERPAGFLIAGTNPFRRYDSTYSGFIDLLAGQIAAGLANARAYEGERRRAEALTEIDRAKTTFFSNVSHEFRTPLTLMLGPLEEVLSTAEVLPRNRELVAVAHRNSLRLLKLVNTLLDFSRIEAGRMQARYEPVDLSLLTAEIASNFSSATGQAGLKLVVDCSRLPQPVYIDREMWEKIVLNLISNAFKFTFDGSITVDLKPGQEFAELQVKDTGTGIPAEELPRLFDRFHRVDGSRGRTHEGTGIGLALVQELVKSHGGAVSVESEIGKGSTFTVRIPFGDGHLPAERVVAEARAASPVTRADAYVQEALRWLPDQSDSAAVPRIEAELPSLPLEAISFPGQPRPRILLAEDNADMRDYVTRLLCPYIDVTAVANGQEALASLVDGPPDLILSDVMMPVVDGFELLKQVRANPQTSTLPVILLSARAGEESRVEGIGAGADDYLIKPFSARELLARVTAHLKMANLRRQAGKELRESEERLRRVNADLEQFAYSASHDLREPLRNVAIYTQLLQQKLGESADPEIAEFLEVVVEGTSRMESLLRDLLAYTQITNQMDLPGHCDAGAALRKALDSLQAVIAESGALVTADELPSLPVNEVHLHQLFQNLIGNAVKYRDSQRRCQVHISAVPTGSQWQFSVRDNGIGIAPQYHKQIFGIFKRLHTVAQYSGTGIGLAIAQRIVQRYGGEIWVESELGKGATFLFTLSGEV